MKDEHELNEAPEEHTCSQCLHLTTMLRCEHWHWSICLNIDLVLGSILRSQSLQTCLQIVSDIVSLCCHLMSVSFVDTFSLFDGIVQLQFVSTFRLLSTQSYPSPSPDLFSWSVLILPQLFCQPYWSNEQDQYSIFSVPSDENNI